MRSIFLSVSERRLPTVPPIRFAITILSLFCSGRIGTVLAQEQLTNFVTETNMSSVPTNFFVYKNFLLFQATTAAHGKELWVTDGTQDKTVLLKDIWPGATSSSISGFVLYKDKVYFIANNGADGHQLWVTDGTPDGTLMITTSIVKQVSGIIADANFIYFFKKDSAFNLQLWKSDGTSEGTVIVKEIEIWNEGSNILCADGLLYFTCQPKGSNDTRVWRSDGTAVGTFPVSVELDGNGSHSSGTSHPTQFINFNGKVYFVARGPFASPDASGLMQTNGTEGGTLSIKSMHSGSLIHYGEVFVHNNKMYFTFFDLTNFHFVIWESDGSALNTTKIFDQSFSSYFTPASILAEGNNFYFTIGNTSSGTSLVRFNIQTKSVQEIKEVLGAVNKPFSFSKDRGLNFIKRRTNGPLYVGSKSGIDWAELWLSDGTTDGTTKITSPTRVMSMASLGSKEFLSASATGEFELWTSEGTTSSTLLFKDLNAGKASMSIGPMSANKSIAIFQGRDLTNGTEPWTTNGTLAGTGLLKDIVAGSVSSGYQNFTSSANGFIFSGTTSGSNTLYHSDGTSAGTTVLMSLPQTIFFSHIETYDGKTFYYAVVNLNTTHTLYKHTIGEGAPIEVKNFGLNQSNVPLRVSEMLATSSGVYLLIDSEGGDLWKSDGTTAGTVKVMDFGGAESLTLANSNLFFNTQVNVLAPFELYKSNGTAGSTAIVKDENGKAPTEPNSLTAFGDKVIFTAFDALTGTEVWISDGTAGGTKMLKDINGGPMSGALNPGFVHNGGNVYFKANDGIHGPELWKTDGTTENTVIVKDLFPGSGGSYPHAMKAFDGKLFFSAYTPEHGFEIWSSDGSADNTTLLVDVLPGPSYSNPTNFIKLDDYLLFTALTTQSGAQLWGYKTSTGGDDDGGADDDDDDGNVTAIENPSEAFSIYPNPSGGLYKITRSGKINASIEVLSFDGRTITTAAFDGDETVVDLTPQPPGMYVIRIIEGEKSLTRKVSKL